MKWLNPKPEPKIGDTRERFPFAWLPTQVENHKVWLERYWIKEELKISARLDEGVVYPVEAWVEIERGFPVYY